MQMTETHPERRLVRSVFRGEWGDGEVRLTPERPGRMSVRRYLMMMGQHRYVLSPRGNGAAACHSASCAAACSQGEYSASASHKTPADTRDVFRSRRSRWLQLTVVTWLAGLDAHRTWEALLVGTIPIVRSSKLNPLYERLPVIIVNRWEEVHRNVPRRNVLRRNVPRRNVPRRNVPRRNVPRRSVPHRNTPRLKTDRVGPPSGDAAAAARLLPQGSVPHQALPL